MSRPAASPAHDLSPAEQAAGPSHAVHDNREPQPIVRRRCARLSSLRLHFNPDPFSKPQLHIVWAQEFLTCKSPPQH